MSRANRRRYATDPLYRATHLAQTTAWRQKKAQLIGSRSTSEFRSGMEERLAPPLLAAGASYESLRFTYHAKARRYVPDFILPNGIVIEVKGWFTGKDRAKMLAVKEQHPGLDLRMVLATPRQFITQNRTTTQAEWCEKHGFPWAEQDVPASWLTEPTRFTAQSALSQGVAIQKAKRNA